MKEQYDVVIIGSGLGGLVSAIILVQRLCARKKQSVWGESSDFCER